MGVEIVKANDLKKFEKKDPPDKLIVTKEVNTPDIKGTIVALVGGVGPNDAKIDGFPVPLLKGDSLLVGCKTGAPEGSVIDKHLKAYLFYPGQGWFKSLFREEALPITSADDVRGVADKVKDEFRKIVDSLIGVYDAEEASVDYIS